MSFFKKVFGEKAKPAPTLPQAIRRLKLTQDVLLKRQAALEDKIKKEIATARKNASTNKKLALQAVQKKKRFERQLQQLDGALTTLEAQLEILESANTNTLAVASMEKASKALKATQKDLDVAKVEQILDEMAAQREVAGEIADAISQPVGFEDDFDEDELERELQELEDLEDSSVDRLLPTVPQEDIKDKAVKKAAKEALAAS